jgi:osmotically-inducible protein OsmY
MTKTSPARFSPLALILPLLLGMIAFASMRTGTRSSTTNVFAEQNRNTSTPKSAKKSSTKVDCSTADDAALTAQIKERLSKQAILKNEKDIDVDVKAGVVTLSGRVSSMSHRTAAVAEAKKVKCVKNVVHKLYNPNCYCAANEFCCQGVCQTQPCPMKPKTSK